MSAEPTRSLHRKLAQVMYEAERIPKNGTAPREMGGYKFVQVGDAADYIRKALAEKVITMMPTSVTVVGQQDRPTKSGGSMTTVDLITEWTLTDGESGESITIMSFGAGADGGDKYSGKASTSAMKYALLSGFLLSTGEDSELGTAEGASAKVPEKVTGDEELEILGNLRKSGTIVKGTSARYGCEFFQSPDGHVIGFKLKLDGDDRDIPQVLADGDIGEALWVATGGDAASLLGQKVTVRGRLHNVKSPNRRGYYRLVLTEIVTDDWHIPAPSEPLEAESLPLPLDDEERELVGGGLPS